MEREGHRTDDRWQTLRDAKTDSACTSIPLPLGWIVVLKLGFVARNVASSITLECWK